VGVCGNFPYNVSSQIVFKVLENRCMVPEMVGMFQKEVAQRMAASHGGKEYGILSVLVQAYYRVETIFHLAPGAFVPPPKVHSTVIRLVRYRSEVPGLEATWLFKVVKTAFQQRRKTLRNALSTLLQGKDPSAWPTDLLGKRAEALSLDELIGLAIWLKG
jgi:16S rRNA (adenine1518-N6/adenine1519-N6)-dimethyltransferase